MFGIDLVLSRFSSVNNVIERNPIVGVLFFFLLMWNIIKKKKYTFNLKGIHMKKYVFGMTIRPTTGDFSFIRKSSTYCGCRKFQKYEAFMKERLFLHWKTLLKYLIFFCSNNLLKCDFFLLFHVFQIEDWIFSNSCQ